MCKQQKLDAKFSSEFSFFFGFFASICISIVLFKFLRSILFIMALPELPSNFKYKALFYSRFFAIIPKPSALDSLPF